MTDTGTRTINQHVDGPITQAVIDDLKGDLPNVLICIGFTGAYRCYLNVDLETAKRRFRTEFLGNGEIAASEEYDLQVTAFRDTFEAYEIRG